MKKTKIIRDRKVKTLMIAGVPQYETIDGKKRLVYARKYGMAIIKQPEKEKYGLVNVFNEIVIDTKYDFCCYPNRGHIFVMKKGLWGFANDAGKLICPCEYNHIYTFKYGMAVARKGSLYGLVNQDGGVVLKCKYTREQAVKERKKIVHRM